MRSKPKGHVIDCMFGIKNQNSQASSRTHIKKEYVVNHELYEDYCRKIDLELAYVNHARDDHLSQ